MHLFIEIAWAVLLSKILRGDKASHALPIVRLWHTVLL